LLNTSVSFYQNSRNFAFRSAVIGAKDIFIASFLSEQDLTALLRIIPRKILEFCTFNEIREIVNLVQAFQLPLAVYYPDHSLFDTDQPKIYISRLKGLVVKEQVKDIIVLSKCPVRLM